MPTGWSPGKSGRYTEMNYNQYNNPKATQASKYLATATFVIALVGIIVCIMLLARQSMIPGLAVIMAVAALVLCRPRIEARIVNRILNSEDDRSRE